MEESLDLLEERPSDAITSIRSRLPPSFPKVIGGHLLKSLNPGEGIQADNSWTISYGSELTQVAGDVKSHHDPPVGVRR